MKVAIALFSLLAALGWLFWPKAQLALPPPATKPQPRVITPAPVITAAPLPKAAQKAQQPPITAKPSVPLRDPLAPGINAHQPVAPQPLGDPEQYLEAENARHQALLADFAKAARPKIAELERLIAKGRAEGISAGQLAKGERKLAALKAALAAVEAKAPIPRLALP